MSHSLREAAEAIRGFVDAVDEILEVRCGCTQNGHETDIVTERHIDAAGVRLDLFCSISWASRACRFEYYENGRPIHLNRLRQLLAIVTDIAEHGARASDLSVPQLRTRASLFPHIYIPAICAAAGAAENKTRRTALLGLAAEFTATTPAGEEILI